MEKGGESVAGLAPQTTIEREWTKSSKATPGILPYMPRATSSDAGDGVLDTDGPVDYLMITECPSRHSAKGMFTQTIAVIPVDSEGEYQQRAIPMRPDPNQELRLKVAPKEDGEAVFLFKDDDIPVTPGNQFAADGQADDTGSADDDVGALLCHGIIR